MTERTIRIVQRCTGEEAAAIVAAISAFEDRLSGRTRSPSRPAATAPVSGKAQAESAGAARRRDGAGIRWTRSQSSLGRGF